MTVALRLFCDRYTESFHHWWDDLGSPHVDDAMRKQLIDGILEATDGRAPATLSAERDALLLGILKATKSTREKG